MPFFNTGNEVYEEIILNNTRAIRPQISGAPSKILYGVLGFLPSKYDARVEKASRLEGDPFVDGEVFQLWDPLLTPEPKGDLGMDVEQIRLYLDSQPRAGHRIIGAEIDATGNFLRDFYRLLVTEPIQA